MNGLTDLQTAALDAITNHDAAHPITGKAVAGIIGLKERKSGKEGADMRSIVHALRVKGYPICATGAGYWWPKNKEEAQAYILSFQGRIDDQQVALDGMRTGLGLIPAGKRQIMATAGPPIPFKGPNGVLLVPAAQVESYSAANPDAVRL